MELISVSSLVTSMDRLPPPASIRLAASRVSRFGEPTVSTPRLQPASTRFAMSGDERYIRLLSNCEDGLIKLYARHYEFNWAEKLCEYARRVLERSRLAERKKLPNLYGYYRLESDYIQNLLFATSPDPLWFKATSHQYFCHLPYRDQILHLESLSFVGRKLLDLDSWTPHEKVWDKVIFNIVRNRDTGFDLAPKWQEAVKRDLNDLTRKIASLRLEGNVSGDNAEQLEELLEEKASIEDSQRLGLLGLSRDLWVSAIRNAWDLVTGLHEIGRFPELPEMSVIEPHSGSLPDEKAKLAQIATKLKEAEKKAEIDILKSEKHSYVNCWKMNAFNDGTLSPDDTIAFWLADRALWQEEDFLKAIDNPDTCMLGSKDAWEENPIGALLATCIVLCELACRVCWYADPTGALSQPQDMISSSYMPVKQLELDLSSGTPKLIYLRDLREYPQGIAQHSEPIPDARLVTLKKALGPDGLGLLGPEQAANLKAIWRDVDPLPNIVSDGGRHDEAVKGEQQLAATVPDDVLRWRSECETIGRKCKELAQHLQRIARNEDFLSKPASLLEKRQEREKHARIAHRVNRILNTATKYVEEYQSQSSAQLEILERARILHRLRKWSTLMDLTVKKYAGMQKT